MKKIFILLLAASVLLTACVGNTSLWGQYLTPTPIAWIPETPTSSPSPMPDVVFDTPIPTDTLVPTSTPTPLANFVTSEPVVTEPTVEIPTTIPGDTILYYAQGGDWLPAVASRFGVGVNEITSPKTLPKSGFIDPGTLLIIPDHRDKTAQYTSSALLIPDSEIVFSGTAVGFDIEKYVQDAGGFLSTYREYLGTTAWTSGGHAIKRLAYENSINPRLLLALLDYEANWVRGKPVDQYHIDYPLGHENYLNKGLFGQMTWVVNQLSVGYYGWRKGNLKELTFADGKTLQLDPSLNAGTVAVMTLFSRQHSLNEWLRITDVNGGFLSFYRDMFGDPWARAEELGNLFPPSLRQPEFALPFEPGTTWAFTGGPHSAWGKETEGPLAAVDFAPQNDTPGCFKSDAWVEAISAGLVVRSENGLVMVDMDGDGSEQTGWNVMYMHIADNKRVAVGQWVDLNDHVGHPSCEGGVSTGTHVHIARKYNGEWMIADGPIPFTLDGWTIIAGAKAYLGKMVNGDKAITADVYGQSWSLITRDGE